MENFIKLILGNEDDTSNYVPMEFRNPLNFPKMVSTTKVSNRKPKDKPRPTSAGKLCGNCVRETGGLQGILKVLHNARGRREKYNLSVGWVAD